MAQNDFIRIPVEEEDIEPKRPSQDIEVIVTLIVTHRVQSHVGDSQVSRFISSCDYCKAYLL